MGRMIPLVAAFLLAVAPLHADTGDTGDTERPSTHDTAARAESTYTQASGCDEGSASAGLLLPVAALLALTARRRRPSR